MTLKDIDYSALQQCMHCGLCLSSCPTYVETGRERNSPRGRISLMRAIADDRLAITETFADEMSYCVGCLACTTACPAGVDYSELLEVSRSDIEKSGVADRPGRTFIRWATLKVLFTHPRLFHFAAKALRFWQRSGLEKAARKSGLIKLLPTSLRNAEPQAPRLSTVFSAGLIQDIENPKGAVFHRVLLLTGCVQDVAFAEVNRATADVLLANGCEVVTPRHQSCCGSLHAHNGDLETAKLLARRQLDEVGAESFDAIISNAAGCGSHLKHYGRLLADDPLYAERAKAWDLKVRDISEWLVEIGFRAPRASKSTEPRTVTYHDACHLCHGQAITAQPRAILNAIPGVKVSECKESTWCCGSAGIYSLTQPKTAGWLRDRKIAHLNATGAKTVATANPGCQLHLQAGYEANGLDTRVVHPVTLLAAAYKAEAKE